MNAARPELATLAVVILTVPSCSGFRSATSTLDPQGPVSLAPQYKLQADPTNPGAVGLFEASYAKAYSDQVAISKGLKSAPTSSSDPVSMQARQMASDGTALVDQYCSAFFKSAGKNQTWLNVGKDITAVIGTAATGVLALASPSNAAAAGAVALATATAYNGADLYTRDFLFGSDNIESVRSLTTKALLAHTAAVLPNIDTDKTVWSFRGAAEVINDHQDLCTPASIHAAVLAAIQGGTVTAYHPSGSAFTTPASASAQLLPAATQAGAAAAPDAPAGAAAAAAAVAGNAGSVAATNAAASPGATFASVGGSVNAAITARASSAAVAAGATASQANRISSAVSNVYSQPIAAAALPNGAPSTRSAPITVNGQQIGQ
jgi:hypothetical protein